MAIADLTFENAGCCGGAAHSNVIHDNGLMSRVYREADGSYGVVCYAGAAIYRPMQTGLTEVDADAVIAEHAAVPV